MKKRAAVVFRAKAHESHPELRYVNMNFDIVTVDEIEFVEFDCPGCNTKIRLPVNEIIELIRKNGKVGRHKI